MTHPSPHPFVALLGSLAAQGFARVALIAAVALSLAAPLVAFEREAAADPGDRDEATRTRRTKKRVVRKKRTKKTRRTKVRRKRTATKVRTTRTKVRRKKTRRTTVVRSRPSHSHTTVHHYHDSGNGSGGTARRTTARSSSSSVDPYIGVGLGVVGAERATTSEDASTGVSVQLGMRGRNLGVELGLLGVVDDSPDSAGTDGSQQLKVGGVSADARLMLPVGPVEPYALAGVGVYDLDYQDGRDEMKPAVNLGLGADVKVSDGIRLGGRYTHHGFWLDANDPGAIDADPLESAWSTMGTLSVSF